MLFEGYYFFFFFQAEDGIRDIGGDWSSDVCSSDLRLPQEPHGPATPAARRLPIGSSRSSAPASVRVSESTAMASRALRSTSRSGERRGGKEGRSRWSPYH